VRILILSHYFPPEVNAPANRTFEHARRWVAAGHDVTVVTGVPNHPDGVLLPGYSNRFLQEERIAGIRVIRTWMYLAANRGFSRRVLSYVLFGFMAVVGSLRARRVEVVVATSPQFFVGVAGAVVARLTRARFVLEVRDLWPESIIQLGQLSNRSVIRLLECLETRLYRSADEVVTVTRSFVDHVARRGVPRSRIHVVFNGVDFERFTPRPPCAALRAKYGLDGKFVAAYIGTLGLAHGLEVVLDAAELLKEQPDIAFLLIGSGAEADRLRAEVDRRNLQDTVRMPGLLVHEEIPAWLASVDAALVLLRDLPVFDTVIPSKTFEYMAMRRPVVLAVRGEMRRMVARTGTGFLIPPEDAARLAETVVRLRDRPGEAAACAEAGYCWVRREFDRDRLALQMADILAGEGPASASTPGRACAT